MSRLQVGNDLTQAVECLRRLNRVGEFDAFIEKVILAHKDNGLLLFAAAEDYLGVDHQGSIVAGSFVRGPHRGGTARYVSAYERDRVRALQLMVQAMGAAKAEKLGGQFYFSLANMLLGNRGYGEAWRLQYLTDLDKLPDYEEGYYFGGGRGIGAPVNADGTPVYYHVPQSWKAAQNDGERWRWALHMAAEVDPGDDRAGRDDLRRFPPLAVRRGDAGRVPLVLRPRDRRRRRARTKAAPTRSRRSARTRPSRGSPPASSASSSRTSSITS